MRVSLYTVLNINETCESTYHVYAYVDYRTKAVNEVISYEEFEIIKKWCEHNMNGGSSLAASGNYVYESLNTTLFAYFLLKWGGS